jgi:hypothetical protein
MVEAKSRVFAAVYEANRAKGDDHGICMKRAAEAVERFTGACYDHLAPRAGAD